MTHEPDLVCPACGGESVTGPTFPLQCDCGGLWSSTGTGGERLSAGRTQTPLWLDPDDDRLLWKREDLNATGSFKDRGAAVLIRLAADRGAERLVLDSSGSAALAAAAVSAPAGLPLTVHTPASLPPEKRETLEAFGVGLVAAGNRGDAETRARAEAKEAFYFSHVYHPAFSLGVGEAAREVLETLGDRPPTVWVVPVGNGSLLLGLHRVLVDAGLRESIRIVAVQAAACPGLRTPGTGGATRAAGIGIADPPRRREILEAVARGGEVLEIDEDGIEAARRALGTRGVAAESAAAAAGAAAQTLRDQGEEGRILGWLTGSGLRGG